MDVAAPELVRFRDALVERCQTGDEAAFARLYHQYAGQVHRRLTVLTGAGDADDALQQVFIIAFDKIHSFNHTSKFSSWLYGIATRVALNAGRSRRRWLAAMDSLASSSPTRRDTAPQEAGADSLSQLERLHRLLAKVSAKNRVAFLLYFVEDLDLHEVATHLGISEKAAWARINRARQQLLDSWHRGAR